MRNAILQQQQQQPQQSKPIEEGPSHHLLLSSSDDVPLGIQEMQAASAKQSSRIHQLLNNMTVDNDGQSLANFEPLDHPVIQKRSDDVVQPDTQLKPINAPFQPSASATAYPSYHVVYESQAVPRKLPAAATAAALPQDARWMEKINYMIYLLEQQQNEKTNHITEEFVLYTFLGVFIIFIVDGFSRGGKYVR
jgi:hypothetical protein